MSYERLYAKIDLDAIGANVSRVRENIPGDTMIMAVIKADAYGHGSVAVSQYLDDKVDWYGVSNVYEGIELRNNGVNKPILILGATMPDEMENVVKYTLTPAVFDYERAKLLSDIALKNDKIVNIHIKVDTGMSRIGLQTDETSIKEVCDIAKLPGIRIEGIFSHFAKADETDKSSALEQKNKFDEFIDRLNDFGISPKIKHISNSAGIMELDAKYNMVRMGIMLYGLYPSDEMDRNYKLYPAMELISHVTHVKELETGRGVSYGHTYVTDKKTKVATVPVGYADGYPRCLSNKGYVLAGGKKCPILGRVCMDQMMIDVTDTNVKIGDDVILFGSDGTNVISVEEVADNAYSFNYEMVCRISRRVPRVYFRDGKHVNTVSYLI